MPIVGVGNPAPGAGQSLQYMGGRAWAGWSGEVTVANSTADLFNFRSPDKPLKAIMQMSANLRELSANNQPNFIKVSMDGIIILHIGFITTSVVPESEYIMFKDYRFVIPSGSLMQINCFSDDAGGLTFTSCLTCKEIGE